MSDGGAEIIIKGGSVHLNFDNTIYLKDAGDPKHRKHEGRKITRVTVENEEGQYLFDSDTNEGGLQWTITVSTQPTT